MVVVWARVRPRFLGEAPPLWIVVAEALIALPWLFFPVLFGAALLDLFRPAITGAQLALGTAGAIGIWARRGRVRDGAGAAARGARESWIDLLALAAVALFVAWGWLMPFPESLQGHHHYLLSLISDLWRTGSYEALPGTVPAHEVLGTPPLFGFLLATFSLPQLDAVSSRPIFLLPGLFALISLQLMRLISHELVGRKEVGSIAFLLACFGYYTAFDFTEISPDMFAPIVLIYFVYLIVRWVRSDEQAALQILLLLCFTWVVRRQLFLLLLGIVAVALIARLLPWAELWRTLRSRAAVALLIATPLAAWTAFAIVSYDSVLFPYESRNASFGLIHVDELLSSEVDGRNSLVLHFLLALSSNAAEVIRNLGAGTSFSTVLTALIVLFFAAATRIPERESGRQLRRIALVLAGGS